MKKFEYPNQKAIVLSSKWSPCGNLLTVSPSDMTTNVIDFNSGGILWKSEVVDKGKSFHKVMTNFKILEQPLIVCFL